MKEYDFFKNSRLKEGYTLVIKWYDILWVTLIGLFSVVCLELFYRMIVNYNDRYSSDMRYYVVKNVQEGGFHDRFIGVVFQKFYDINQNTMEANIYLAAVIAAIIVVNYLVIRFYIKDDGRDVPRYAMEFFSLAMLFIGPMYIPVFHEWYYRFSFQTWAWHSPTQQSMTLFSLIASLCFLKMYLQYEERIHPGWWIATMVTCFLSASVKPSFLINLIPAIIVLFIIELIEGGKEGFLKRFGKLFAMGCTLVPCGLYILFLHTMEFKESTTQDGDHQVIFDIGHVIHYNHLGAAIICGLAFPLVVFAMNLPRLRDRKYRFAAVIFLMGVLQWALLTETGKRGKYGNFGWGQIYGSYFLTLVSTALALENFRDPDFLAGRKRARTVYFVVLAVLLVLHIFSQLCYFRLILTGHGYMH